MTVNDWFQGHTSNVAMLVVHHLPELCINVLGTHPPPVFPPSPQWSLPCWHLGDWTYHACGILLDSKRVDGHVTAASRLTRYYGDKPTNKNSADGCYVDCTFFVLRMTYFFPQPSQTQASFRQHMHTHKHTEHTHTSHRITIEDKDISSNIQLNSIHCLGCFLGPI